MPWQATWAEAMDASFEAMVQEPNDEFLWRAVLPRDVVERSEYWWDGEAVHVKGRQDFHRVTEATYFAHVKQLDWAEALRGSKGIRGA